MVNISWAGFALCCGTLSGAAYGIDHFQKASQSTCPWGHRLIGLIECFPVIGAIAAAIDRLFSSNSQPSKIPLSPTNSISPSSSVNDLSEIEEKTGFIQWNAQLDSVKDDEIKFKLWIDQGSKKGHLNVSKDNVGTILHYLAKVPKHLNILKHALTKDVDLTIQSEIFENTPLMWALANGNNSAAMALIKHSQDHLDIKGCGNTPLHLAVAKGYTTETADKVKLDHSNLEIVEALLESGANPNIKNNKGFTPLHLACARRDLKMIEVLLKYNADKDIPDSMGRFPQQLIHLPYKESSELMKTTATYFILDSKLHQNNQNKAIRLMDAAA